jgi:hypothetical protein
MPSPFPGIDPYLEGQGYWPDFHARFINEWCEAVAQGLPDNYEARIDERVRVVALDDGELPALIRPDVTILRQRPSVTGRGEGGVATLEPVTMPVAMEMTEEVRESRIAILHRPQRKLVAVLELLAPANKAPSGRGDYLAKRRQLLGQEMHLVELDLLLGGARLPMGRPLPPGDCYAIVARAERRPDADVYAWTVRNPLPVIPIPLLPPDKDLRCDLAAVFATTYERGRYARSIDYAQPLALPPGEADAAWVAQTAGRR